ncbi:retinal rod [Carpediemonas membranifera]|uniref:Retinal rod n=1 Tax=Carpediemonas membranifera TaxID=201153 RepID=A0A8J6B5W8_9EUKA|nr:retinal rod [Carpediemonas membranifera]|eukprot:KAG9393512.1 retinal rod [Carpediemonas membranifera]
MEAMKEAWLNKIKKKSSRKAAANNLSRFVQFVQRERGSTEDEALSVIRSEEVRSLVPGFAASLNKATAAVTLSAVNSFRNSGRDNVKLLGQFEPVASEAIVRLVFPYNALALIISHTGMTATSARDIDVSELQIPPELSDWLLFSKASSALSHVAPSTFSEAVKQVGLSVNQLRYAPPVHVDVNQLKTREIETQRRTGRPRDPIKVRKVIKDKRISLTDEQFRHQLASSHLTTTRRPTILDLNPEIRSSADLVPPTLDNWLYNRLKARMIELHDTKTKERQSEADKEAEFGSPTRETEMPEGEREGDTDEEAVSDEPAYQAEWMHYEVPAREESEEGAFGEEVDLCKSADEEPKIDHDEHGGEVAGRDGDGEIQENVTDEERSESDTADSIVFSFI